MSIATVVTGGFGSFGSVNLLPTIGYSVDQNIIVAAYPYTSELCAYRGGGVAVKAVFPNNVIGHTAGKSAPAVCTSPRLP